MKMLPENVCLYKQTPEFNEKNIPSGLFKDHKTRVGTWAKIIILEGSLIYRINTPKIKEITLTKDNFGVVESTIFTQLNQWALLVFISNFIIDVFQVESIYL